MIHVGRYNNLKGLKVRLETFRNLLSINRSFVKNAFVRSQQREGEMETQSERERYRNTGSLLSDFNTCFKLSFFY